MTSKIELESADVAEESHTPILRKDSRDLQTLAKGGTLGLLGRLSMLFFGLILQVILARTLGPANVGIVNLAVTLTMIAGVVALFGLDKAVVRYIPGYRNANEYNLLSGTILTSLVLTLGISLFVATIFFLSTSFWANTVFNKPELEPVLRILAISLPFTALMLLSVAIAQAFKKVSYRVGIEQTAVPVLKIVGVTAVIFIVGSQVIGVAYAFLAAEIGGCLIAIFSVWRLYPFENLIGIQKPVNLAGPLLIFSAPLALTALFIRSNNQLETFLLGTWSTVEQVGIYSISIRPAAFVAVSLFALNYIYAPFVSELFTKGDRIHLTSLYKTVTRWAIIISLPIFMVVFTFSTEVMGIFGEGFSAGVPVVRVLALSQFVFVVTGPSAVTLTMTGYPRLNFFNVILTLGITFAMGIFLIPRYGAMGAAIGGFVTICLMGLLSLFEVYFILHIHPYQRNIFKPLIAASLSMISVGFLNSKLQLPSFWRLFLLGTLMVMIYLLMLFILGLDENDREIVEKVRQRFLHFKSSR